MAGAYSTDLRKRVPAATGAGEAPEAALLRLAGGTNQLSLAEIAARGVDVKGRPRGAWGARSDGPGHRPGGFAEHRTMLRLRPRPPLQRPCGSAHAARRRAARTTRRGCCAADCAATAGSRGKAQAAASIPRSGAARNRRAQPHCAPRNRGNCGKPLRRFPLRMDARCACPCEREKRAPAPKYAAPPGHEHGPPPRGSPGRKKRAAHGAGSGSRPPDADGAATAPARGGHDG